MYRYFFSEISNIITSSKGAVSPETVQQKLCTILWVIASDNILIQFLVDKYSTDLVKIYLDLGQRTEE